MISTIRKGLNKKALRVVVWILLLALFGLPSVLSIFKRFSQPTLQSIAMVNGHPIDITTYKQKVAEEERRLQFFKQFGAQAEELLRSLGIHGTPQELALNELIQEALIQSSAEALHLRLSQDYLAKKMQDPSFLLQSLGSVVPPALFSETGALDFHVLARYLQRHGISMATFEKMVKEALYKDMVFKFVQGAVYIPEPALKEAYIQEYSSKKFVIIPFSRAEALITVKKTVPSDEQLKQFFIAQNTQARRYWVPEKRHVTIWSFEPKNYGITVSEKEIKQYYAKNKETYKGKDLVAATPAITESLQQEKFKRLFNLDAQRIIAGAAHDDTLLATFTANKKAQTARRTLEQDQSAIARKAFVTPVGKKSFVLDDKSGAIIQVETIDKSYLPDIANIKNTVLRDYYDAKAQELLEKQLQDLKASNEKSTKEEVTPWINPQKADSSDALKKRGLPVARMLRMTHIGDFMDAFTADYAYAIRLEAVEPVNEESFLAKKEDLLKGLLTQKAQRISQSFVASLQKNATIVINKTV